MKNSKKDMKDLLIELIKDIEMVVEGLVAFLKNIWNFFTNPSLLLSAFKFKSFDFLYKKFLENETLMKLLSLVGAIVLVLSTHYIPDDVFQIRHSETIENYELTVLQNPNHILVDSAIPNSVTAVLTGETNHVRVAYVQRHFELVVDLRPLAPGTHTVPVEIRNISGRVDVILSPSNFTVHIAELEEIVFPVEPLLVNSLSLPEEWVLSEPRLSLDEVQIRGAGTVLANIASVQAAIDVNTIVEGTTEFEVPITAFDSQMNPLNVEIVPDRLTVAVDVFQHSQLIPFTYQIRGNPPPGSSISEIQFDPSEVEMFADPEIFEELTEYVIQIDLSQLNSNGEVLAHISTPEGVQHLRDNQITVRVIFAPTVTTTLRNPSIEILNLGDGLEIETLPTVDVQVRGAPRRTNILTEDDISVTMNLNNLGPGEHTVNLVVRTPEFTVGELSTSAVEITIIESE